jgi:hypothetical protein
VSRRSGAPADPGAPSVFGVTRSTERVAVAQPPQVKAIQPAPPQQDASPAPAPAAVGAADAAPVTVASKAIVELDAAPPAMADVGSARQRRRSSIGRRVALANETEDVEVTLVRPNANTSFGLSLGATTENREHVVTAISDGGLAVGELFIGDRIVAINGEETAGHSHQEVVGMITKCTELHLVVARSVDGVGTLAPTLRARIAKRTTSVGRRTGQFSGVVGDPAAPAQVAAAPAAVPVPVDVTLVRKTVHDRCVCVCVCVCVCWCLCVVCVCVLSFCVCACRPLFILYLQRSICSVCGCALSVLPRFLIARYFNLVLTCA